MASKFDYPLPLASSLWEAHNCSTGGKIFYVNPQSLHIPWQFNWEDKSLLDKNRVYISGSGW